MVEHVGSEELVSRGGGSSLLPGQVLTVVPLQPLFQPLVPKVMVVVKCLIQTDEVINTQGII